MFKFFLRLFLMSSFVLSQETFSGFYTPDIKNTAEDFSAAWLISIDRFMLSEPLINNAPNMAGVSFAVVRNKLKICKNCVSLLTRDYLDFMVEHLSSTSNQIPFGNKDIFRVANQNLKTTSNKLRDMKKRSKTTKDPRLDATLGVLVYSPISFSVSATPEQDMIRHTFFEATFFSVYRYFPNIVIFVANDVDAQAVRDMSLPFMDLQIIPTPLDFRNRTILLPRLSLETIINGTKVGDPQWSWVKYLYFTEGDQVVHLRGARHLYDAIDNSDGAFAIVPHRMQTLPLMPSFEERLQRVWPAVHGQSQLPSDLNLVTENLGRSKGSCCDSGRNLYSKCGNGWWYNCPEYGLANFTTWLRIGKSGYTFPPSTEHRGVCTYSAQKQLCPKPDNCKARVPHIDAFTSNRGVNSKEIFDLCQEMPIVRRIGHFPPNPDY